MCYVQVFSMHVIYFSVFLWDLKTWPGPYYWAGPGRGGTQVLQTLGSLTAVQLEECLSSQSSIRSSPVQALELPKGPIAQSSSPFGHCDPHN